jgi:NAD(P)-dependent dehydrogenase (short-subunit alcohol dehydrogenase family)
MKSRVLVTGAAGDIGSSIVERLVNSGYSVLGLDKVEPKNQTSCIEFFIIDLNQSAELSITCAEIRERYSPLWGFVHCAGVYPIVALQDYTSDLWEHVHSINLKSAYQIAQQLSPDISRGGRMVLVSSGAAHLGSNDVGYSTSKAGLIGLTRGLAKELASKGILVNAVCPGLVSTQMSARMAPDHFAKYTKTIPLGRPGLPEEIAVCVAFLLDEENSYMTGASIDVNGGLYMR